MEMLDRQLERINATCACNMTYVTMTECEIYNYICQRAVFQKKQKSTKIPTNHQFQSTSSFRSIQSKQSATINN